MRPAAAKNKLKLVDPKLWSGICLLPDRIKSTVTSTFGHVFGSLQYEAVNGDGLSRIQYSQKLDTELTHKHKCHFYRL